MKLITPNTAIEFACFLAALLFLYKDKSAAWRLLIPYLFLTFVTEMIGLYMRLIIGMSNLKVYNTFLILECLFNSYFFFSLYTAYKYKLKWLLIWLGFFAAMYLTEMVYNGFKGFVSITATIMSVVFVLACLYYYYLKLKDEQYEPLLLSPAFWWVCGTLFFYFGSTVCNLFFDYLSNQSVAYSRSARYAIFIMLNITLYSCWTLSFICRYRQRKLQPSLH
jgi:uncharacterized membrane protein YfcA